ncbi:MAG: hypothetical protein CL840_21125 [Crocinitomicaceae bacterium]|nr:hypothetical protein [Crocinitomicaceae bacterium]|tara:strand:- start:17644 stop:18132 length:489 start_codon:yes stop_codon:yes gene_type:complete
MEQELQIDKIDSSDEDSILKIADWYQKEWNTPIKQTVDRLSNSQYEGVYFQLVVRKSGKIVATGGLSDNVNLLKVYPEFVKFGPWVALLYTDKEYRNQGIGKALLEQIELNARTCKLDKIYLYTFTAESLYRKSGWKSIERVKYKGHNTVIMEKEIKLNTTS